VAARRPPLDYQHLRRRAVFGPYASLGSFHDSKDNQSIEHSAGEVVPAPLGLVTEKRWAADEVGRTR